ncbi:MAG: lactonase family protein [Clostridia bacterium]|nr:lactonase family protein [Clostridia bacterium]
MRLYVGTYSEPILFGTGEIFQGRGEGLYACDFDGEDLRVLQVLKLANPSFFALHPEKRKIYAVNEGKTFRGAYGGGVTEIDLMPDGSLSAAASFPAGGTDPCHAAISPEGRLLAVSNYADGSVTFFPLDGEGRIAGEGTRFLHAGGGPDAGRQQGAHAHSVLFGPGGRAWAVDLGADALFGYRVEGETVRPDDWITLRTAPGSGPRAGVLSPEGHRLYLIHEMACTVSCLEVPAAGPPRPVWTVPLLSEEEDAAGVSGAALQLSPDGQYLYASLRGRNTLSVFALNPEGPPELLQTESTRGSCPRHFTISPDGAFVLVGNQDSDSISLFRRRADGRLRFLRSLPFPTPVCLQFAPGNADGGPSG